MGIIIVLVGQAIQFPLASNLIAINQCGGSSKLNDTSLPRCFQSSQNNSVPSILTKATDLYDSSHTIWMCLAITVVNYFILVGCFWPKYRRIESEKRSSFEKSVMVK